MTNTGSKNPRLLVDSTTLRQAQLLARVIGVTQAQLAADVFAAAWAKARSAGLVTDAMLTIASQDRPDFTLPDFLNIEPDLDQPE